MKRVAVTFRKGCCSVHAYHSPIFDPDKTAEVAEAYEAVSAEVKRYREIGYVVTGQHVIDAVTPKTP